MAAHVGPTFLRIMLGAELTRLRDQAGLTGDQAAKAIGLRSASMISKVESGHSGFERIDQFMKLLDEYKVPFEGQEMLADWYRNAKGGDWWSPKSATMPSGMNLFLAFESGAKITKVVTTQVVNGLLQAETYARALHESARIADDRTSEFVENAVEVRMTRKKRITEEGMELVCIMDESALRNMVGGPEIMLEQYEEIRRLASLPNVTVRIIPFSAPTYRVFGEFHVLDFDRKELPDPVVVTSSTVDQGMKCLSKLRPVKQFVRRFDILAQGALPAHETPAFLEQLEREVTAA
ncbi:helix-turn-helix transcriptional regulator [Streptomyces sp. NPDC001584]|uniref:helix-turn-helix domain-containing protein n=1 Tax=Streptomyces sp. NPDC001584 TaxID=3154521 RepID=UPI00331AB21B